MSKTSLNEPIIQVILANGRGAIYTYTESRYKKFEANILASGFRVATKEEILKKYPGHEMIETDTKDAKENFSPSKINTNGKDAKNIEDKKAIDKEAVQKEDKEASAESDDVK